ncbi:hypothetical protein BJ508DRAFT_309564 [Ascobolus immersus RN42]|uniref:Uncharacterized protein n=1 Tax=Ascobolus immersus RN42 TaxID=1160509 RepID=A0A3N4I031_ASCIM|nr:hypothetical protein BJ508DRAFT_309564 [Ascobolus immersus RN42]
MPKRQVNTNDGIRNKRYRLSGKDEMGYTAAGDGGEGILDASVTDSFIASTGDGGEGILDASVTDSFIASTGDGKDGVVGVDAAGLLGVSAGDGLGVVGVDAAGLLGVSAGDGLGVVGVDAAGLLGVSAGDGKDGVLGVECDEAFGSSDSYLSNRSDSVREASSVTTSPNSPLAPFHRSSSVGYSSDLSFLTYDPLERMRASTAQLCEAAFAHSGVSTFIHDPVAQLVGNNSPRFPSVEMDVIIRARIRQDADGATIGDIVCDLKEEEEMDDDENFFSRMSSFTIGWVSSEDNNVDNIRFLLQSHESHTFVCATITEVMEDGSFLVSWEFAGGRCSAW